MKPTVACVGECMVELQERPDGSLRRSFGGDTLNTAVYLARLGVTVDYVTALGDDPLSDEMILAWRREGVGTSRVFRLPGYLPGLYLIRTDAAGERHFLYWRDSAAARRLCDEPGRLALHGFDIVYLSGITLSIFASDARQTLFEALATAKNDGAKIAFDLNFRARGWPDRAVATDTYRRALGMADIVFASAADLSGVFGDRGKAELLGLPPHVEKILKFDRPACRVVALGVDAVCEGFSDASVVDTAAAGDSFAAAYIAGRLAGAPPLDAARAGHDLAASVIGHPGAIIPLDAMPNTRREVRGSD